MAEETQCENCGAVLLPADRFCGECGAPRPETTVAVSQPDPAPVSPVTPKPAALPERRGQAAVVLLVVLGVLACLVGLVGFLLFGLTPSEVATPAENWLYSALCCLLPLCSAGAILLALAVAIRHGRLRKLGAML